MAQQLKIDIVARDKSTQALQGVRGSLGRLKNSVFSLQTAFIGLGAGLIIRSLVNTGKQLEGLQVRLKFLFGSAKEGGKAFDEMAKFASKVPFSLEEIQAGSGVLAVVSKDAKELAHLMEITGNVAAVTGLDFKTTSEQIQRSLSAGISAADLFRDKGVKEMLGFKAGATVSIEETAAAFERVFGKGGRYDGATKALAETFEGTLSMIGDKVFNFKKVLLEAGFFDELKSQFGNLNTFLADNTDQIERIAKSIGEDLAKGMISTVRIGRDLIPTIKSIGNGLKSIFEGFMKLPQFAREVGIVGAFLFGKKGAVALAGISFLIDKIDDFVNRTKKGLGIFDMNNIDSVQSRLHIIQQQIKDFAKVQNETITVAGGKIEISKEELGINDDLLIGLKEEFNFLTRHLQILKEKTDLEKIYNREFNMRDVAGEVRLTVKKKSLLEEITEQIKKGNDAFKIQDEIVKMIKDGVSSVSKSIAESIVLGKELTASFKALAQQILVNIISKTIERLALLGIEKLLLGDIVNKEAEKDNLIRKQNTNLKRQIALNAMTGGGGSFLSGLFGGKASGGKASGGSVQKGQPYMVGENGAEMFVPNQSGQIQQTARGGSGGGSTTVNFNINTVDASGFEELLVRSRGTITQLINSAVNERGSKNLI
jgi:hypothetical protein